jgi:hypothetical protein
MYMIIIYYDHIIYSKFQIPYILITSPILINITFKYDDDQFF